MAALFRRIGTAQPYSDAVAITPSDTINLTKVAQGLHIGVGGTVTAVMDSGSVVQFTCIAGEILPISFSRINSAGTGASALTALYA
jgi:hypothetical protein